MKGLSKILRIKKGKNKVNMKKYKSQSIPEGGLFILKSFFKSG